MLTRSDAMARIEVKDVRRKTGQGTGIEEGRKKEKERLAAYCWRGYELCRYAFYLCAASLWVL